MKKTISLLTWLPRKVLLLLYFLWLVFSFNYALDHMRRALNPTNEEFLILWRAMWQSIWQKLRKSGL